MRNTSIRAADRFYGVVTYYSVAYLNDKTNPIKYNLPSNSLLSAIYCKYGE